MQTSYNMLSQRNSKNCPEEWVADFTKGDTKGRDFLTTEMNNQHTQKGEHGYPSSVTLSPFVQELSGQF